jgi:hypothetical protein
LNRIPVEYFRFDLLKTSDKRIDQDGITSLRYDVLSYIKTKLYTKKIQIYHYFFIFKRKNYHQFLFIQIYMHILYKQ